MPEMTKVDAFVVQVNKETILKDIQRIARDKLPPAGNEFVVVAVKEDGYGDYKVTFIRADA